MSRFDLACLRRSLIAIFAAMCAFALYSTPAAAADRDTLVAAVRGGGYILYFRHAPTDWLDSDQLDSEAAIRSCDRNQMRQLSDEGRATAKAVGAAMRRLQIPVSAVFASEYCRTTETAKLLNLGPVQTTRDVLNTRAAAYVGGREALTATARKRLSMPPPDGSNVVLVAHGNVLMMVAHIRPPEGGSAVVRPRGDGTFEVVGVLSAQDWLELADAGAGR